MKRKVLFAMMVNASCLSSAAPTERNLPFSDEEVVGFYQIEKCGTGHDWGIDDAKNPQSIYFHKSKELMRNHRFRINYMFFYDTGCSRPKVAGIWDGHYMLGGSFPKIPFTRVGDFAIDRVQLAVMDRGLIDATRGCGVGRWMVGMFKDVTKTGCQALGPLFLPTSVMKVDYDIIHLHSGVLKSGLRTPGMAVDPTGRPTMLQDGVPLVRQ